MLLTYHVKDIYYAKYYGKGKKIKKGENYIKKGEKGRKNASFWAINLNLIVGEKIESHKGGWGNDQNAQYISLYHVEITQK